MDRNFILVVDDDDGIRDALSTILEDEGYDVVAVEHGRAALDKLEQGARPCVILLDLMMPVMDGASFRRAQMADPALSAIPVVVITAAGQQLASSVPADAVLAKPLKLEKVLEVVSGRCLPAGAA